MPNLLDAWFADLSPGRGRVTTVSSIYTSPPPTATIAPSVNGATGTLLATNSSAQILSPTNLAINNGDLVIAGYFSPANNPAGSVSGVTGTACGTFTLRKQYTDGTNGTVYIYAGPVTSSATNPNVTVSVTSNPTQNAAAAFAMWLTGIGNNTSPWDASSAEPAGFAGDTATYTTLGGQDMLLCIACSNGGGAMTSPTGWTMQAAQNGGGGNPSLRVSTLVEASPVTNLSAVTPSPVSFVVADALAGH